MCGKQFISTRVRTKKVDAEQDAAKLAFEYLQQHEQQQNDDTSAASKNMILIVLLPTV